jgi:hypothetical protein
MSTGKKAAKAKGKATFQDLKAKVNPKGGSSALSPGQIPLKTLTILPPTPPPTSGGTVAPTAPKGYDIATNTAG